MPRPLPPAPLLVLAAVACLLATGARAQVPLTLVDDSTTVSSVGFEFVDGQTLLIQNLELQVATKAPPSGVARFFGAGSRGATYPLLPIELARDAIRLERYYADSGFPLAEVDYDVALDTTSNAAAVTFVIEEGPPLLVNAVSFAGPGQSEVAGVLAPEIRDEWAAFTRATSVRPGDRLDNFALVQLQSETVGWLRNRGYAWADAGAEQFPDTTGLAADIRVKVNVGPRARIGSIRVEGNESLDASTITREVPVKPGDLFNAGALVEGQQEIFGLGLFTLALVDIDTTAVRGDTLLPIRVRVRRGPSRVANGFLGYFSDGGVTVRAAFRHLNAFEGARQLGAELEWRTGLPDVRLPGFLGGGTSSRSVTGGPIRDFRLSFPFRQPYVFSRRFSYAFQPSVRQRSDEIEASRTFEIANTLLYTLAPLRTASLSLTGRTRDLSRGLGLRIIDAGGFALPPGPLLPDTLRATTGVLGVDAVWGTLDDPLQPTRGFVLRPSASVAGGDLSYGRVRLAGSATRPFGRRSSLVVRGILGALAPFGDASPDAASAYVLFRDQLFYAGGTNDVRGWSAARLGPKAFSVTPPVETAGVAPDPSVIEDRRDVNYIGVGGRYKALASVQANLPFPLASFGPQWGTQVFVDAGWVGGASTAPSTGLLRAGLAPADSTLADIIDGEGGVRVGTGFGIQYLTPVGYVAVGLGIKVNPSYLDLRDPAVVYCGNSITEADPAVCFGGDTEAVGGQGPARGYIDARLNGSDFDPEALPENPIRGRLQLYFSIGQTF